MGIVELREITGYGVGASLKIFASTDGTYIGSMTFDEHHDWHVTTRIETFGWNEYYRPALALANEEYPQG